MWDAAKQRADRKENPAKYRKYDKDKRAKNPEYHRLKTRKAVRKFRGCPDPVTPEPAGCEICGKAEVLVRRGTLCHLSVDHQHDLFRGWLCNACNLGLGKLGDTIEALERAIIYLKKERPWSQTQLSPSMTSLAKSAS